MLPEDLEVLRKIQWNFGDSARLRAVGEENAPGRPADHPRWQPAAARRAFPNWNGITPAVDCGLAACRNPPAARPPCALRNRPRMERQNKPAWITGANGLIGSYLVQTAPKFAPHWPVRALDTRRSLTCSISRAVRREFQKDQPQLIIHCAAITTVAEAQNNPALARRVNVEITKLLAELAAEIQFVFFSTDLVFDGRKGNYGETDAANPMHVYGETKAAAEQIVLKNPRHLVVRTSHQRRHFARGQSRLQRTIAARVEVGTEDETVHGRIPLPDFRRRDGARRLGTGGPKTRRAFSRGRGGKAVALADWTACWPGAGRN